MLHNIFGYGACVLGAALAITGAVFGIKKLKSR
jgi:hypothetical protein